MCTEVLTTKRIVASKRKINSTTPVSGNSLTDEGQKQVDTSRLQTIPVIIPLHV